MCKVREGFLLQVLNIQMSKKVPEEFENIQCSVSVLLDQICECLVIIMYEINFQVIVLKEKKMILLIEHH